MSVTVRTKPLKDKKRYSLYLDIYDDNKRSYEFLKLYIFKKPRTAIEAQTNKDNQRIAETMRAQRELQLNSSEHNYMPKKKRKIDFLEYFNTFATNYTKKDNRLVWGAYNYFKSYVGADHLRPDELTENFLAKFKEYLDTNLNGETPANYFSKLKKVIRQAHKEKIILENHSLYIVNKKNDSIKKDTLTTEEIQLLANTPCFSLEVKRAFLFSCVTGLRYCDIDILKWSNIQGTIMSITQQKTGASALINLNSTALNLLGERAKNDEKVFNLPSHTACLKHLRNWVKEAKITKKITWHCARHTFGTNLVFYGTDTKTASGLLGHKSMKYTEKYVHIADSRKEQAVHNLPEIIL